VDHLISRKCREMKIAKDVRVSPGTVDTLKHYPWPGNVRELQNLIERSLIQAQATASKILSLDLNPITGFHSARDAHAHWSEEVLPFDEAVAQMIRNALKLSNGKVIGAGGAAERLGLHPSTLRGKMRKLNIRPSQPKRAVK
jgi:DNA-binding NtrC family response regulator